MTSREAFEATFAPLRYKMLRICGEYVETDTDTAWSGWQEATERAVEVIEALERERWEGLKQGKTMRYTSAAEYVEAIRGAT